MSKYKLHLDRGDTFGRLTVIKSDYVKNQNKDTAPSSWYYICQCSCGNEVSVLRKSLVQSNTKSCGCLNIEATKKSNKKSNSAVIKDGLVYVQFSNAKDSFVVDVADYLKIKQYCWRLDFEGYASSTVNKKTVRLHRILMMPSKHETVDHINRNKLDNQRSNLRVCAQQQNVQNMSLSKRNQSGRIGVYFNKRDKVWVAQIRIANKSKFLGQSESFEDACEIRRLGELKYYGEFAPSTGGN